MTPDLTPDLSAALDAAQKYPGAVIARRLPTEAQLALTHFWLSQILSRGTAPGGEA